MNPLVILGVGLAAGGAILLDAMGREKKDEGKDSIGERVENAVQKALSGLSMDIDIPTTKNDGDGKPSKPKVVIRRSKEVEKVEEEKETLPNGEIVIEE